MVLLKTSWGFASNNDGIVIVRFVVLWGHIVVLVLVAIAVVEFALA